MRFLCLHLVAPVKIPFSALPFQGGSLHVIPQQCNERDHGSHPHRWSGAEKDKQALRKGAYTLKVLDAGRTDEILVGSSTISYL